MRATDQEQTGGAGVSEVSAKFQRIGWGPVPNAAHDLGTDLLVQARDLRRFDRGLIVGAQVKAGGSWFDDREVETDGTVSGWWYYERDAKHFDDWVRHGLPHLLVLHDLEENVSYWVHVTAERVRGTGKGCKILVPANQTIDRDHVEDLLAVAAQQRAAPVIEGTTFAASAQAISPGRRLRYALIAPRLLAPHRNLGFERPIGPEEALGLEAQGRFLDLVDFSDHHEAVPDPRGSIPISDWRWSFVKSIWSWAVDDDIDALSVAFDGAPTHQSRAASAVVLVCALLRLERHDEALPLLDGLIDEDALSPVDQGWLLVQRARIRAEVGDIAGARGDAAEAQRQFLGDADDVTVSALASAAAWQLFATADLGSEDLGGMLAASDTAVSWWRSQRTSWALREASNRTFLAWAEDTARRWSREDRMALDFFAAEFNADVTGEHGSWRAVSALGAKQALIGAHASGDMEAVAEALDALRRSGDVSSLKLAVRHLTEVGPAVAVAKAVDKISLAGWTHTTAKANFEFWAAAGDLMPETTATDAAIWSAELVAGDFTALGDRVRPSFLVDFAAARALVGLLVAAGAPAHEAVARLIAARDPTPDLLKGPFSQLIGLLEAAYLSREARELLWRFAAGSHNQVAATALGWLADHNDERAKAEVLTRASTGDLHALSAMGAVTVLDTAAAGQLITTFVGMVRETIELARKGISTGGVFDGGHGLALFNLWFPEVAQWGPLIELLSHERVSAEDKRGACVLVVALTDQLPTEVRDELAANADAIGRSQAFGRARDTGIGGLGTAVAIAVGAIDAATADAAVLRLAIGSSQERVDAASVLGRGFCPQMRPLLASLAADPRIRVRAAASHAVGRLVDEDRVVFGLAEMLAADTGVVVPNELMRGLSGIADPSTEALDLVASMLTNPSAIVRRTARSLRDRH